MGWHSCTGAWVVVEEERSLECWFAPELLLILSGGANHEAPVNVAWQKHGERTTTRPRTINAWLHLHVDFRRAHLDVLTTPTATLVANSFTVVTHIRGINSTNSTQAQLY